MAFSQITIADFATGNVPALGEVRIGLPSDQGHYLSKASLTSQRRYRFDDRDRRDASVDDIHPTVLPVGCHALVADLVQQTAFPVECRETRQPVVLP